MPNTKIKDSVSDKLSWIFMWLFALGESEIRLLPVRFNEWLTANGFMHTPPGATTAEIDYGGFSRWMSRNGFMLFGWALGFELYSMILGSTAGNVIAFLVALAVGVVIFGGTWIWFLHQSIGRVRRDLLIPGYLVTILAFGVLVGAPLLECLFADRELSNVLGSNRTALLLFAARGWAVAGFVLLATLVAPFVWTVTIGPALISLLFQKTKSGVEKVTRLLARIIPGDSDDAKAAMEELLTISQPHTSLFSKILFGFALLTAAFVILPRPEGLGVALALGIFTIIVTFLMKAWGFTGNLFQKILFGITAGFLTFIGTWFGVALMLFGFATMYSSQWLNVHAMAISYTVAVIAGLAVMVFVTLTSTTEQEQLDRRNGNLFIRKATLEIDHIGPDGKPVLRKYNKNQQGVSEFEIVKKGRFRMKAFLLILISMAFAICLLFMLYMIATGQLNATGNVEFATLAGVAILLLIGGIGVVATSKTEPKGTGAHHG